MASNDSPLTPDVRTATPTDDKVRFQFYFIRGQHLSAPLGFQKMLDALKAAEPTWILGPGRLKKLLNAIAIKEAKEEEERKAAGPPNKSIRHYRILGHDGYGYATIPNSDMQLRLNIMQNVSLKNPTCGRTRCTQCRSTSEIAAKKKLISPERAARNAQLEQREIADKRGKLPMLRMMRDMGLDPKKGDVVWDDEIHRQFVVLVTRVDKETGLKEIETR
ncbi:hypothetical protein K438DRAFT_1963505 [Mycena galopus ATCC 62051]|nr:hypothetical protein K438DRAFT_1963505 [Mycena galopus ATCC 62051]